MTKAKVLMVINPFLLVLLLSQAGTGIAGDDIPPAIFKLVHVGGGLLLVLLAVVHLLLNWGWVRTNYLKRGARKGNRLPVEQ